MEGGGSDCQRGTAEFRFTIRPAWEWMLESAAS